MLIGLAVPEVGAFAFATAKPHVDQMELVKLVATSFINQTSSI